MAFSFSYIYEASDKFTPVAKKIAKAVKELNVDLDQTSKLMKTTNTSTKVLQSRLKKTFESANPEILRAHQHMKRLASQTDNAAKSVRELQDIAKKKIKGSIDITQRTTSAGGGGVGVPVGANPPNKKPRGGGGSRTPIMAGGLAQAAAMVGTLGGISKAADIFSTYQATLTSIRRVIKPTAEDMDFLKTRSREMGRTFAISSNDILGAYKTVSQFTGELPIDQLDKMTEASVILSKAGEVTLGQAAVTMSASLSQFGKDASHSTRFLNIMAEASIAGSSEIRDTADALAIAGTVAKSSSISFEVVNASLQAMAKQNIIGRLAGTGFAATMMRLQSQFFNGKNVLKDGLIPVLEELEKKQGDAAFMTEVFGENHAKTGLALVSQVKFIRDLSGVLGNDSTAAMRLAMEGSNDLATSWDRLGVILSDKVIDTLTRLEPVLKKSIDDFSVWLDSIDESSINGMADALITLAKAFTFVATAASLVSNLARMQGERIGQGAAYLMQTDATMQPMFNDTEFKRHEAAFNANFDALLGTGGTKPATAKQVDVPTLYVKVESTDGKQLNASVTGKGVLLENGINAGGG